MKHAKHVLAVAMAVMGVGCAGGTEGDLSVAYQFRGLETPDFVTVYLVDGNVSNIDCDDLRDRRNIRYFDVERNLPATGSADFFDVPVGRDWIVYAVAFSEGAEIASACESRVRVRAGKIEEQELFLQAEPLRLRGQYEGDLDFALGGDQGGIVTALSLGNIACTVAGDPTTQEACKYALVLAKVLSELDIRVGWFFDSFDTSVTGRLEFLRVEGKRVSSRWDMIDGSFTGFVVGRNKVEISNFDIRVNTDELVRFLLQEVIRVDFGRFGTALSLLVDEIVGELNFIEAEFDLIDENFDGVADAFNGEIQAESTFFLGGGELVLDQFRAHRVSAATR